VEDQITPADVAEFIEQLGDARAADDFAARHGGIPSRCLRRITWEGTQRHAQGFVSGILLFSCRHIGGDTPFRLSTKLPLPDADRTVDRWACTDPEDAKRKADLLLARFVELVTMRA
jgi:hypothetical protein